MTPRGWPATLCGGIALASAGAVVAALVSQYGYDMQPCAWCVLQRLIFVVIALLALLAALVPVRGVRALLALPGALLALCGAAAALWQQFVAAKSLSCNLTLADRIVSGLGLDVSLPKVFEARASCADAAVNLLGVPYALWSCALFVLLLLAFMAVLRSRAR
jgi:disulfide bond formation protein DsbB